MSKKSIKAIKEEVERITSRIHKNQEEGQLAGFPRLILIAHYTLFTTTIWKSFDLNGNIPFFAKFSLLFFGLGVLSSSLYFLANSFADYMEGFEDQKKLIEIENEHGKFIEEKDNELYMYLKTSNFLIKWALSKNENSNVSGFLFTLMYVLLSFASILLSAFLLIVGSFFLGISAL